MSENIETPVPEATQPMEPVEPTGQVEPNEPFVTHTKNRLLLEVVTINGREYTTDKNDFFVRAAEDHPELREHVVAMFDRAGDSLAGLRYPENVAEMPLDDRTIPFLAGVLDHMPAESDAQHRALDRAVALVTDMCDEQAREVYLLAKDTVERM